MKRVTPGVLCPYRTGIDSECALNELKLQDGGLTQPWRLFHARLCAANHPQVVTLCPPALQSTSKQEVTTTPPQPTNNLLSLPRQIKKNRATIRAGPKAETRIFHKKNLYGIS